MYYKLIILFILFANTYCQYVTNNNNNNEDDDDYKNLNEILLKLVHQAVKPHRELVNNIGERQNHLQGYDGFLQSYQNENYINNNNNNDIYTQNPYLSPIYFRPPYINRNPQTVRDVLETIAINDKLHCIPRLLCEITSGYMTNTRPSLPFNIDLDSFQQVLSTLNVFDVSPIITLGSAVLLGITSNGNDRQCITSYPKCPTNTDALIYYLNNYNGGFFRYFNGIQSSNNFKSTTYAREYPNYMYVGKYDDSNTIRIGGNLPNAEKRILTKPYNEFYSKLYTQHIKFPLENTFPIKSYQIYQYKSPKTLVFPDYNNESNQDIFKGSYRKRKGFSFPTEKNNELIFEKPSPNYLTTSQILPDRTGTGELIIDTEEFY